MKRFAKVLLGPLLIALITANGCTLLALTCESILIRGLAVAVQDSITGQPVAARPILAIASTPGYADTLQDTMGSSRFWLIEDRAGIYTLEVTVPTYSVWRAEGIEVEQEDECHVRTRDVTVRMQPA